MKRHPSSWSIVFAAPKTDARILRRSERKSALRDTLPLAHAADHEVDALLASLDAEEPPRRSRSAPPVYDPELHIPTVPLAFRPVGIVPPSPRHEPVLAKVMVDEGLLVPPPVRRKRRDLDVTQLSMRRSRESLALVPTSRPLAPTPRPAPSPLALLVGWCAFALGLGSLVVAIVTSAGTM